MAIIIGREKIDTGNDGILVLERLLYGRQADRPDVAVERGGPVDLDDGDVVLVSGVHEIPMHSYLRHHKVQRSCLVRLGEIVLAEPHYDVARLEPETTARTRKITVVDPSSCNCNFVVTTNGPRARVCRALDSAEDVATGGRHVRNHYKVQVRGRNVNVSSGSPSASEQTRDTRSIGYIDALVENRPGVRQLFDV